MNRQRRYLEKLQRHQQKGRRRRRLVRSKNNNNKIYKSSKDNNSCLLALRKVERPMLFVRTALSSDFMERQVEIQLLIRDTPVNYISRSNCDHESSSSAYMKTSLCSQGLLFSEPLDPLVPCPAFQCLIFYASFCLYKMHFQYSIKDFSSSSNSFFFISISFNFYWSGFLFPFLLLRVVQIYVQGDLSLVIFVNVFRKLSVFMTIFCYFQLAKDRFKGFLSSTFYKNLFPFFRFSRFITPLFGSLFLEFNLFNQKPISFFILYLLLLSKKFSLLSYSVLQFLSAILGPLDTAVFSLTNLPGSSLRLNFLEG